MESPNNEDLSGLSITGYFFLTGGLAPIRSEHYQTIKTYLDNDKAGHQGAERFKAEFGAMVLPQGEAFAPHHDLNDLLRARGARGRA